MLLFLLSMVTWMIDEFGSDDLREKYIPALASMEVKLIVMFSLIFHLIIKCNKYLHSIKNKLTTFNVFFLNACVFHYYSKYKLYAWLCKLKVTTTMFLMKFFGLLSDR